MQFFYNYLKLSKFRIVVFALISSLAGYTLAWWNTDDLTSISHGLLLGLLLIGLWFVMSGSFALNQSMEWRLDGLMKRTRSRPIPAGQITIVQALLLAGVQIIFGLSLLLAIKPLTAGLAILALCLYNICYTMLWKKKWIFSAVPGAVPGALPVMIGYSVLSSSVLSIDCLYLFFILFLWQMPHFWSLALHYREDYQLAGVPVPPLHIGLPKTLFYIGVYLLFYLGLVLCSPLLFKMNVLYVVFLIPICIKVFLEFLNFSRCLKWQPFFLWLNLSVLIFIWAPIGDLWIYSFLKFK